LLKLAEIIGTSYVAIPTFEEPLGKTEILELAEFQACCAYKSRRYYCALDGYEGALRADALNIAAAIQARSEPSVVMKHRPGRLIVIRHGESEHNVDKDILKSVPDDAVHLTERGWSQALAAGEEIRKIIGDSEATFIVSPYVRTRETFHAMAKAWKGQDFSTEYVLTSDGAPSGLKWLEDFRLREMEFGNFEDPEKMKEHRASRKKYGEFYYRFPDGGESCADVLGRMSSFLVWLERHWELHPDYNNYVIVSHGIAINCLLMRWFNYSVDEFYSYENFTNCEYAVLEESAQGRLELQFVVRNVNDRQERFEARARKPNSSLKHRQMRFN
jgi:broad specificity phosphatase PhoE